MNTTLLSVIAGVAFGAWPLIMQRSGLAGNGMLLVVSVVVAIMTLPFLAAKPSQFMVMVDWRIAIAASVLAGIGMMAFTDMLARTPVQTLGTLYMVVLLVQFAFPLVYHLLMGGKLSTVNSVGMILAIGAVVLLAWPQPTVAQ